VEFLRVEQITKYKLQIKKFGTVGDRSYTYNSLNGKRLIYTKIVKC